MCLRFRTDPEIAGVLFRNDCLTIPARTEPPKCGYAPRLMSALRSGENVYQVNARWPSIDKSFPITMIDYLLYLHRQQKMTIHNGQISLSPS